MVILILAVLLMMTGVPQRGFTSALFQGNTFSDSSTNALNMGVHYFNRGEYDRAMVHFDLALAEQPRMSEAYNDRALVYDALGEYDKALADFSQAIQLAPGAAYSYSNRGAVYLRMGQHEQAIADLDKAIELDSRLARAYQSRGSAYMDLGDLDRAIADFSQAIELTPEFIFAVQSTLQSKSTSQGNSQGLFLQQDLMNAQTYADLPEAYASRAMAYFQKGETGPARADMERARELGLRPDIAQQIAALLGGTAVADLAEQPTSEAMPWTTATGPAAKAGPFVPRAGHWEGTIDQGGYQGTMSFEVGPDGSIHNFDFDLHFDEQRDCRIAADEIPVTTRDTFSLLFGGANPQTINGVQGAFDTETSATGQAGGTLLCSASAGGLMQVYLGDEVSWSAHWAASPGGP
jgi:Tfp pilus assembly protein PilF